MKCIAVMGLALIVIVFCGCGTKAESRVDTDTPSESTSSDDSDDSTDTSSGSYSFDSASDTVEPQDSDWNTDADMLTGNEETPVITWVTIESGSFIFGSPEDRKRKGSSERGRSCHSVIFGHFCAG